MPLTLTNPHPAPPKQYIHTGIGGAGNCHRYTPISFASASTSASTLTSGHPATPSHPSAQPRQFITGRGGAGNKHATSEMAMFSFDEELSQLRRGSEAVAPVYHIGRGGAGNLMDERTRLAKKERMGSVSSEGSGASEKTGWLREKLGRPATRQD